MSGLEGLRFVRASLMKPVLQFLVLVTVLFGLGSRAAGSDRWETLRAINWVENPTNHTRYGSKGELGPYQFRPGTWRLHTKRPFRQAVDRAAADEVAAAHYDWICEQLQNAGIRPTITHVAMAWNCGVNAVIQGRVPTVSRRYAERVRNLVERFKQEQGEGTPGASFVAQRATLPPVNPNFSLDEAAPVFRVANDSSGRFALAEPVSLANLPAVDLATLPVVQTEAAQFSLASAATVAESAPSMFVRATQAVAAPRFALIE